MHPPLLQPRSLTPNPENPSRLDAEPVGLQGTGTKIGTNIARRRTASGGFTLAEVALAMAIFSFALVSMMGLLSLGLKSTRRANLQTAATNLLSTIAADIRASTVTPDPSEPDDLVFRSPRLKIEARYKDDAQTLTLNSRADLILTDAATDVAAMNASEVGTLKTFRVALRVPQEPGIQAIRVFISWPSNLPIGAPPEGSVDSLVTLPLPPSL
jgi:uncharacterized protein (TIGR02598 family)